MRTRSLAASLALGIIATLALSGVVLGAETVLTADLAGDAETAEEGSGSAMITLDPEAGTACWELTIADIGAATQSHIHVGAEGVSGDVVVPLDVDGFEDSSEGCVEDQDGALLQTIIDDPSGYYVNIHTEEFPGGAIRGQLVGASEPPNTAMPVSDGSTGLLGALFLALAVGIGLRAWRPLASRD